MRSATPVANTHRARSSGKVLVALGLVASCGLGAAGQSGTASLPGLPLASHVRISSIYDVEVVPPYLYAHERGLIRVLDVRNPAEIREVGSLEVRPPRTRMALRSPYLYLRGFGAPLAVVDVSNPASPRMVAEHPELVSAPGKSFQLAGDIALLVRRIDVPGPAGSGTMSTERLFLDVLDVARDPLRPRVVRSVDLDVRQVLRIGDLGILRNMTDLLFYDVSDPRSPRRLGRHEGVPLYWTGGTYQANMVAGASGSRVVVAYESIPAELLDISAPSRPAVLGRFEPRGLVRAIAVTPTHAFAAYRDGAEGRRPQPWDAASLARSGGSEVFDLRDPARPVVVAHEPLLPGVYAEGLTADAAHVYVGAGEDGLLVYALPPRGGRDRRR